jgi:hypothetical protein
MRALLIAGGSLVAIAGVQLFVLTEHTEKWFAWHIEDPLIAAFLGAFYWAAWALAWFSARERTWSRARLGVPGVLAFVWLAGIATAIHYEALQLDEARYDAITNEVAWTWVLIYFLEPPILLGLLVHQLRVPGGDPPRAERLPAWFRAAALALGAVLTIAAVAAFIAPTDVWPWETTPLAGRVAAAWVVAEGLLLVQVAYEDDWTRLRPAIAHFVVLGVLQLVALARYGDVLEWDRAGSWAYLALVLAVLAAGAYGALRQGARADRRRAAAAPP